MLADCFLSLWQCDSRLVFAQSGRSTGKVLVPKKIAANTLSREALDRLRTTEEKVNLRSSNKKCVVRACSRP